MATAAQIVDIGKLISRSQKVYHGLPVIAGTRIPVMIIVGMDKEGMAADEIARQKYLDLAQVHAALAYYYANRQRMDKEIAEEEAETSGSPISGGSREPRDVHEDTPLCGRGCYEQRPHGGSIQTRHRCNFCSRRREARTIG